MKRKLLHISIVLAAMLLCTQLQAQRSLSGTVQDISDGSPIVGATVVLKGTTTGAYTNEEGKFTISAPDNATTLVISYIGFKTEEIEIGDQTTFNIRMSTEVTAVDEVVITALGVAREKKALGYAVQEIEGQQLLEAKETNLVDALAGKVAGVQITSSSGAVGASSRIVIRGASSLLGNNQPLFIVDGIPLDNEYFSSSPRNNTNEPANGTRKGDEEQGGADFGNAIQDLNPDDIESMNVLKGPTAVALYGSRAQNGAIIITTKSGKSRKGLGISLSSTYSVQSPLRLPDFQNQYGQGGYGLVDYPDYLDVDESWGDPLDVGHQ